VDHLIAREVQACEAKTHFARLLDEVERGETIITTRHGRAIARIVLEARLRQEEINQAIEDIKELRTQTGGVTREEILNWRHAGHKY
jgi:antitoxin (DNA-binding transcriptional repressor) of toxin-antitoxin stability system